MAAIFDVTGKWEGFYLQNDRKAPISAEFVQSAERIAGWMADGEPEYDMSLSQAAATAGLPPGEDELIERNLRNSFPEFGTEPIRWVVKLPESSIVQGRIAGERIEFLKKYRGKHSAGYQAGRHFVLCFETEAHAVNYSGRISGDGGLVDGNWWINADPERNLRRAEGLFTLHRIGRGNAERTAEAVVVSTAERKPWWKFWGR